MRVCCFAIVVPVFSLHLLASGVSADSEHEDLLRTVVDGYRANRDAFPFMVAHSVVTQGKADSIAKALAGEFRRDGLIQARGYYALRGKTERVDLIYPSHLQENSRVRVDDHKWEASYVSIRESGNGSVLASHFPDNNQAALQPRSNRSRSGAYFLVRPFDMGITGARGDLAVDRMIERSLDEGLCEFRGEELLDGHSTWLIQCRAGGATVKYWVDPERGFLPLRIELQPGSTSHFRLVDIEKCSRGRWLPRRGMTVFGRSPGADGSVPFRETELVEIDVDNAPNPEAVQLDLPPGQNVADDISKTVRVAGKDGFPLSLDPDDFVEAATEAPLISAQAEAANVSRASPSTHARTTLGEFPLQPGIETTGGGNGWLWLAGGVLMLVLVLAGVSLARRRRFLRS